MSKKSVRVAASYGHPPQSCGRDNSGFGKCTNGTTGGVGMKFMVLSASGGNRGKAPTS